MLYFCMFILHYKFSFENIIMLKTHFYVALLHVYTTCQILFENMIFGKNTIVSHVSSYICTHFYESKNDGKLTHILILLA